MDNKFIQFIRGLTTASPDRYSHHFTRHVKQLAKLTKLETDNDTKKTNNIAIEQALNILQPFVMRPCFKNIEDDIDRARDDLLFLWQTLLNALPNENLKIQTKCFDFIFAIISRTEFSMIHLNEDEYPEITMKYLDLLVDTFIFLVKSISLELLDQHTLATTLEFCANVLVVLFFRMPPIQSIIILELQSKRKKNIENNGIFEVHKKKSVLKQIQARRKIAKIKQLLLEKTKSESSQTSSTETIESDPINIENKTTSKIDLLVDNDDDVEHFKLPSSIRNAKAIFHSKGYFGKQKPRRYGSKSYFRWKFRSRDHIIVDEVEQNNVSTNFKESSPDLFKWFVVKNTTPCKRILNFLKSLKETPVCITWIREKESFFVQFLIFYVKHVNSVSNSTVEWGLVSGFDLLIECFWPLMKSYFIWKNKAEMQPERAVGFIKTPTIANFVETAYKLLLRSCPPLVNELIYLALCETNVFSHKSVVVGLNQIKDFIDYVKGTNFNVDLYWFAIQSCLSRSNMFIIRKVIYHLHDILPHLKAQERFAICSKLLSQFFYKLFLHYSLDVRLPFHALLVFRIFKTDRRKLSFATDSILFSTSELPNVKKFICTGVVIGHRETKDEEHFDTHDYAADARLATTVDNYLMNCIHLPATDDETNDIPQGLRVYVEPCLKSYTHILGKFYTGEAYDKASQIVFGGQKMNVKKID